jgi:UDPglucose 6-dehydrogenase
MNVTIFGTGYVGLVTGACMSEMGNHVVCADVDQSKIRILNEGGIPIHEPGLHDLVKRNRKAGRLEFTTEMEKAVAHGTLQFIAVGTPSKADGAADLGAVMDSARTIGRLLTSYKVIVNKSTVPVGTADSMREVVRKELEKRNLKTDFTVASNPEFLKQGAAVQDFLRPDRIVLGADDERAIALVKELYSPFTSNHERMLIMDVRSAEFTKYAANAMLATRISFMNELACIAERVGADIELVRRGMGSDPRIGTGFLYAGVGYGGSCFPKDMKALMHSASEAGLPARILSAVEMVNCEQKMFLVRKVVSRYGEKLVGRTFAMWGLAYKPNTDDMREAPSRIIISELTRLGAKVQAYDPAARCEAQRVMCGIHGLSFADSASDALREADALIIVTDWKEFRAPDFGLIHRSLKDKVIFDGRNLYDPKIVRGAGIEYRAVGRL